ncbi:MAG: T9SS type A sorting domain-containing protein [Bacteroidetes bacterium]|nr:T9SS type A sorting domain-containing protein [Bacteroidota bacterium]
MLSAIRKDFARPPIQARNLFHVSAAMYDAWAAFDATAKPFFLGRTVGGFTIPFNGIPVPSDLAAARREAVSYAAYRLLRQRYKFSPATADAYRRFDSLFVHLGFDTLFTSTNYSTGSAAALGNYIAQKVTEFGYQDGANELFDFGNAYYKSFNPALDPIKFGDSTIIDPNRWQPITVGTFIDQNGNPIPVKTPPFLCPEWGNVVPFAMTAKDRTTYTRGVNKYHVYHDPGPPAMFDTTNPSSVGSELYKWAFTLVSIWQSHLDPSDSVKWDISPASLGNITSLPATNAELMAFYDQLNGGDKGKGRTTNPKTGQPYVPQIVPRGDFTRVLAEFWADGPSSETPPGHWYSILNHVSDHPQFQKRYKGIGPVMDPLEWDVKSYFMMGGAVHDAAISAWGIKGWYDYVRPISAIRYLADRGQCSDSTKPNYNKRGIPLIPGMIELVMPGDSLAGEGNKNVGKIKLYTWKGHYYIKDPRVNTAGVGWILAGDWWPYQRPSFVTPPFAGFISGHSTYSRTAAEVMTLLTGDEYFPGGMAEFEAKKNQYLVFEEGPSVDVRLQWATFRDASDQCSLSRIWGGIHPPIDDIPGRYIGMKIGPAAVAEADKFFTGQITSAGVHSLDGAVPTSWSLSQNHPNPFNPSTTISFTVPAASHVSLVVYDIVGRTVAVLANEYLQAGSYQRTWSAAEMPSGVYYYRLHSGAYSETKKSILVK